VGRELLQVWRYIEQVAAGLDHIHNHGVLHLDIKPENIFVDGKGSSASTEFCDSDFFSDSLEVDKVLGCFQRVLLARASSIMIGS
jgi:serine/threonine protein kinase